MEKKRVQFFDAKQSQMLKQQKQLEGEDKTFHVV